jgi:hypothetical protein
MEKTEILKLTVKDLIVDVENFELCTIEKHRENLLRLNIKSYVDLEGFYVRSRNVPFDLMLVYCWNPAQSKYLVKDLDGCQHMCNPFSIVRASKLLNPNINC